MIPVEAIDETSPHFDAVKRLWRPHSETLGFLPDGAFLDYARDRHILVGLNSTGQCVAYLLYRVVRSRAIIAQFCVAPEARRQGYARRLLDELIQITKHLRGIMLTCRVDFEASKSWPRLGFYPIGRKPGRAGTLEMWWQGHGHSDLFSQAEPLREIEAVLDANVFLDLVERSNEETCGLLADWLQPFVSLCYTAELLVDFDRNQDESVQRQRRKEAEQFKMLDCSAENYRAAEQKLLPLFPHFKSLQDESDFRHLVRALASEADVFVTRDDELLAKDDEVLRTCGLAVLRPGELATQVDVLQHKDLYQRNQVAGTNQVFRSRITTADDHFVKAIKDNHERQHEIRQPLNRYLADPHRFQCFRVTGRDGDLLAAYVVDRQEQVDRVPLFRVCDHRRAPTLARAILVGLAREAIRAGSTALLVTDQHVDPVACRDLGFLAVSEGQLKLIVTGWLAINDVPALLTWQDAQVEQLMAELTSARTDALIAAELEHLLWPLKLADGALPSYIVPIHAKYAEHLFDGRLAREGLFGADVDLALNPESAYYRAPRPAVVTGPARVFWYVKRDRNYSGTMSIRACSRIVEVMTGKPKPLFKRHRHLGVYEWADVLETAGNVDRDVMVFRFDDTELLRPISWAKFQQILRSHGISTQLQSPAAISKAAFGDLYAATFDPSQVC